MRKQRVGAPRKEENKLAGYPEIFLTIAQDAYIGKKPESVQVKDEQSSYPQLHRFNRFRNVLVAMQHPHALAAKDLIARRTQDANGVWWLTFEASGLYEMAVFAPSFQNPNAPFEAEVTAEERIKKKRDEEEDRSERVFEGWFKNQKNENVEISQHVETIQSISRAKKLSKMWGVDVNKTKEEREGEEINKIPDLSDLMNDEEQIEKEQRERVEHCVHAWDRYGSCEKCEVSKIEWEKKTYSRFATGELIIAEVIPPVVEEEKILFHPDVIPPCPPHEWNDIDICSKCGKPKDVE